MYDDTLSVKNPVKTLVKKIKIPKESFLTSMKHLSFKTDISSYYGVLKHPFLFNHQILKIEDVNYSSEVSQFGGNIRQIKGAEIKAFQENMQQLVVLVKQNLFGLLKEVKQSDFYNRWAKDLVDNDNFINEEKKKKNPNMKKINEARKVRDESVRLFKDKWVSEVDGNKLWTLNKPATEQGLDFALLPEMFFGVNFEDPLQRSKSIKKQLEETVEKFGSTKFAKEQAANFLYKFYSWLPTAIKDITTTHKMRVATLKQFYAQVQLQIEFMKPLLLQIAKKQEKLEEGNEFSGFEFEHMDSNSFFDINYNFINILAIKYFKKGNGYEISDLEFSRFGFPITNKGKDTTEIFKGSAKGKKGIIADVVQLCKKCYKQAKGKCSACGSKNLEERYLFYEHDNPKNISGKEFKDLVQNKKKRYYLRINDLKRYPIMNLQFRQKKSLSQMSGKNKNSLEVFLYAYDFNILEVAAFRENKKLKNFELLETFIAEIAVVRDEILKYFENFDTGNFLEEYFEKESKKEQVKKSNYTPIQNFFDYFKKFKRKNEYNKYGRDVNLKEDIDKNLVFPKLRAFHDVSLISQILRVNHGLE